MGERVILCGVASGRGRGAAGGGEQPAAAAASSSASAASSSSGGGGEGASVGVSQAAAVGGPSVLGGVEVGGHGVGLLRWSRTAGFSGCRRIPDGACAAKLVTGRS